MGNLADFINTIAVNAGIQNNDNIKLILSSPELAKIELPAEFQEGFNKKYFTEESAKNSSVIQKYYMHNALDPIDKTLAGLMSELEFKDEDKDEINKITSTYKKTEAVIKKMKELSSKSTSDEDKARFTKEIQKLNGELAAKDLAMQQALKEKDTNWTTRLSDMTFNNKIMSNPLYTSDVQTIEDTYLIAQNRIKKALAEKNAKMVFDADNMNFKLVQADNPDLEYVENHKKVDADSFITKVLADSKLLKTTQQATTTTARAPQFVTQSRTVEDNKITPQQRKVVASIEDDLATLRAAQ